MTPAEAIDFTLASVRCGEFLMDDGAEAALREALQIVEGVARVREALEAGARNLSGVSRAAYHYVLSTDGVAPWPAGVETGRISGPLTAERESNLANTAELHRADALIGQLREALWAVRVLDAWAKRERLRAPSPCRHADGIGWFIHARGYIKDQVSPDAARIAAAKALVAEDPTLEPQELDL